MHNSYKDITDRISEPPKWYDENGAPRYSDFAPGEQSDIYADEIAFVLIACQSCLTQFKVCMSCDMLMPGRFGEDGSKSFPLADAIQTGALHYGDPPNSGCCLAGATMNCEDVRVLEYWRHGRKHEWTRDATFEIELPDAAEVDMGTADTKQDDS